MAKLGQRHEMPRPGAQRLLRQGEAVLLELPKD